MYITSAYRLFSVRLTNRQTDKQTDSEINLLITAVINETAIVCKQQTQYAM